MTQPGYQGAHGDAILMVHGRESTPEFMQPMLLAAGMIAAENSTPRKT
jgi:hypothetical protein